MQNGVPGKNTIAEAQLIGRGARYCPFVINDDDEKYKRKYDKDIENSLRICEELYYHCQYDSRYIDELNKALKETGIIPENTVDIKYSLKDDFKAEDLYQTGFVFKNRRVEKSRKDVNELLPSIRDREYSVSINTGRIAMDVMMSDSHTNTTIKTKSHKILISHVAKDNYSLLYRAFRHIDVFKFNRLKAYFPNLHSASEFLTAPEYLGNVCIIIQTKEDVLTQEILYQACLNVFTKIGNEISAIKKDYIGTAEFVSIPFKDVIKDKTIHITDPHGEGEGVSQKDSAIRSEWQMDLSTEDWFAFEDNYGTSEEKAFVAYFKTYIDDLKDKYDKVYLVRNERQLAIYSFDGGERFEPDYLLFLHTQRNDSYEQLQVFIEPKGAHLIDKDHWKEDFLLQLESKAIPVTKFADDNKYRIWGFHFFNRDERSVEFDNDMIKL